jgi:hypothetical protein
VPNISFPLFKKPANLSVPIFKIPSGTLASVDLLLPGLTSLPTILMKRYVPQVVPARGSASCAKDVASCHANSCS